MLGRHKDLAIMLHHLPDSTHTMQLVAVYCKCRPLYQHINGKPYNYTALDKVKSQWITTRD